MIRTCIKAGLGGIEMGRVKEMLRNRTAKTAFQLVVIRKEECVRGQERERERERAREREMQCDSLVLGWGNQVYDGVIY